MLFHQLRDEFDTIDVAVGGHFVRYAQDQLTGKEVDELPGLLLQHFQRVDLTEECGGDAVNEADLVAQVTLDLLDGHIALGYRCDGLDAVQTRLLGIPQDAAGVAVPVGKGVIALVRLVQQWILSPKLIHSKQLEWIIRMKRS